MYHAGTISYCASTIMHILNALASKFRPMTSAAIQMLANCNKMSKKKKKISTWDVVALKDKVHCILKVFTHYIQ